MQQADNIISFPLNAGTTDFLRNFIGTPAQRLDEVSARLGHLAALVWLASKAEDLSPIVGLALRAIEDGLLDCQRIAELRPAGVVA